MQFPKEGLHMTKVELVKVARELGLKGYSRLSKAELEVAVRTAQIAEANAKFDAEVEAHPEQWEDVETPVEITIKDVPESDFQTLAEIEAEERAEAQLTTEQSELLFDLKRYAGFSVYPHLRTLSPTPGQFRLIKALERNFKVKISTNNHMGFPANRGELSDKIKDVYSAINKGTVKPRPQQEVKASLEHVEKTPVVKPATASQIRKINELEKATGIVNTTVLRDSKIASEVIARYLSVQKCQTAQEVAMTTIQHDGVKQSFVSAVKSYIKRLFQ